MIQATPPGTLFTREGLLAALKEAIEAAPLLPAAKEVLAPEPDPDKTVMPDGRVLSHRIAPFRCYTVDEARILLSPGKPLSKATVYRMGKRGVIETVRTGAKRGLVRFQGQALLEYIGRARKR